MSARIPGHGQASRGRRLVLAVVSGLVVVALVVLGIVLSGDRGGQTAAASGEGAAATSTSAAPNSATTPAGTPSSTAVATGPTRGGNQPPPSLPPVNLATTASVGNGITAAITSLQAIHGTGIGPGNISGPALRVTVVVHNGTAAPVRLDGVSVEMASGKDLQPAPPLDDPSQRPFTGTVAPGKDRQGVYVFRIAENRRSSVTVTVGYQAGAPIMVFTGSAR